MEHRPWGRFDGGCACGPDHQQTAEQRCGKSGTCFTAGAAGCAKQSLAIVHTGRHLLETGSVRTAQHNISIHLLVTWPTQLENKPARSAAVSVMHAARTYRLNLYIA
jgi:hypothetical protein